MTKRITITVNVPDDTDPSEVLDDLTIVFNENYPIDPEGVFDGLNDGSDIAIFESDLEAQRETYAVPEPLAGAITPSKGGVFRNKDGDYLVEPAGDDGGELILVRADGTTATLRGEWGDGVGRMKTPEQIADATISANYGDALGLEEDLNEGTVDPGGIRAMLVYAAREAREPRFRPEGDLFSSTLDIIGGDGEEYIDTVRLRFTNDWDSTLTRQHIITREQARHILAYLSETSES